MKASTHNVIILVMSILLLVGLTYYSIEGHHYLASDKIQRIEMEAHDLFSASGLYGHGLGFLAAIFMLLLWFYILRKRWNRLRGMGRLSQWLKYHMWFGISAPLLASYHSAFKFDGLIGVMYWAMIAVMLSGIVGRYLYGHIPRRRDGHELTSEQINTEKAAKLRDLQFEFGISSSDINAISDLTPGRERLGILKSLGRILMFDIMKRSRVNQVLTNLEQKYKMSSKDLDFLRDTIQKQMLIGQRVLVLDGVSKVFHWWHVIHKPFAYAIFLVLLLHIILTYSFGFTWIF